MKKFSASFTLKRGYFIYSSERESFVTVVDYGSKGETVKERPISVNELDFIHLSLIHI